MTVNIPNKIYIDHLASYGARSSHERLDKKDIKYIRAGHVIEMLQELATEHGFELLSPEQIEDLLI